MGILIGQPTGGGIYLSRTLRLETEHIVVTISINCEVNDDVFVDKGWEQFWASSIHLSKWAFCGCLILIYVRACVRACVRAYVRMCVCT